MTLTVTVFEPSARFMLSEAVPEVTAVPFTVMEAEGFDAVAVTETELTEFATEAV